MQPIFTGGVSGWQRYSLAQTNETNIDLSNLRTTSHMNTFRNYKC